jgi:hypothetical protein
MELSIALVVTIKNHPNIKTKHLKLFQNYRNFLKLLGLGHVITHNLFQLFTKKSHPSRK